jgi:hypothetical protein
MKPLVELVAIIGWLSGIVIAQGFWSTFFAVIIPLWAWYLTIETIVVKYIL